MLAVLRLGLEVNIDVDWERMSPRKLGFDSLSSSKIGLKSFPVDFAFTGESVTYAVSESPLSELLSCRVDIILRFLGEGETTSPCKRFFALLTVLLRTLFLKSSCVSELWSD